MICRVSRGHLFRSSIVLTGVNLIVVYCLFYSRSSKANSGNDLRTLLSLENAERNLHPQSNMGGSGPLTVISEPRTTAQLSSKDLNAVCKDWMTNSGRDKTFDAEVVELSPPIGQADRLPRYQEEKQANEAETNIRFDPTGGVFDKYRLFRTHNFAVVGDSWATLSERKVCLGAQTSVDRLHHLVELVDHFAGPVSMAVFTPDIELFIGIKYITLLRKCFPFIRERVSFHFTVSREHDGVNYSPIDPDFLPEEDCQNHKSYLKSLVNLRSEEMMKWRESFEYPQNLLRNIAKSGCQTNYTYIPDIDMVLPPSMDQHIEDFLSRQDEKGDCEKCAYVIPTYEIADDVDRPPANKTELLSFIKRKKAQQFHIKVFSINQRASKLKDWEKMEQSEEMAIAYQIKYEFKYEPLYIARAETPQFDERFIGFGMTRNTQAYEMYVAGYEFKILNNAFTNHWGFQSLKTRPSWRAKQQENNNKKFDEFAKEVTARYDRDPYNMLSMLKKLNLKNVKVAYGTPSKAKQAPTKEESVKLPSDDNKFDEEKDAKSEIENQEIGAKVELENDAKMDKKEDEEEEEEETPVVKGWEVLSGNVVPGVLTGVDDNAGHATVIGDKEKSDQHPIVNVNGDAIMIENEDKVRVLNNILV